MFDAPAEEEWPYMNLSIYNNVVIHFSFIEIGQNGEMIFSLEIHRTKCLPN